MNTGLTVEIPVTVDVLLEAGAATRDADGGLQFHFLNPDNLRPLTLTYGDHTIGVYRVALVHGHHSPTEGTRYTAVLRPVDL